MSLDYIALEGCLISEPTPGASRGRQFGFEIIKNQPIKQILLACETETERAQWVLAIKQSIDENDAGPQKKEKTLSSIIGQLHKLAKKGETTEIDKILCDYQLKEKEEKEAAGGGGGGGNEDAEKKPETDPVPATPGDETSTKEGEEKKEKDKDKEKEKEATPSKETPTTTDPSKAITYAALINGTEKRNGQTLLHTSAEHGNLALARLLVEKHNADVNARDRLTWTPLHTGTHSTPHLLSPALVINNRLPYL